MDSNVSRCSFPGKDRHYIAYHDREWGVPVFNDQCLFEKLSLEVFQCGLSWVTILKKREDLRNAFAGFAIEKVANLNAARLMWDKGIIRNRRKIDAVIHNARALQQLQKTTTLSDFAWIHVEYRPIINRYYQASQIPTHTAISEKLSKNLKRQGFLHIGPITVYAFMQAIGMVNDHLACCFRYKQCASLQREILKT